MKAASLERPTQESGSMARATLAIAILCVVGACAPVTRPPPPPPPSPSAHPAAFTQVGLASWYGSAHAGHPTASGELFDPGAMTAAHRTLPLGVRVRVTNIESGQSVTVRINDRGPYDTSRIIDLSRAAADALGFRASGVARVRIERVVSDP